MASETERYKTLREQTEPDQWVGKINSYLIDPVLFQSLCSEDMSRPPHTQKTGGTAYIVVESNTGIPMKPERIDQMCGAACRNCYLIYGGDTPDYMPKVEEVLAMKTDLEKRGYDVIITGAEILTLPQEYWDAGIFNKKKYLLSAGLIPALSPRLALERITKAGIRNLQMSLHGPLDLPNQFNGVPANIIEQAIKNIRIFNNHFGTYIGIGLNVTVGKHNIERLEEIADYVLGDLQCNALRFNRHKASGGKFPELMLDSDDHIRFYNCVQRIRKKFPKDQSGQLVSVSGDFGKLHRPSLYECPAGLSGGEITIVPKRNGKHAVYSCLEVRNSNLRMGTYSGEKLILNTKPFADLKNPKLRETLGMNETNDGCLAYEMTRETETAQALVLYLTHALQE